MPPRCKVCAHPEVATIDAAIKRGDVMYKDIAATFGLNPSNISRHATRDLGEPTRLSLACMPNCAVCNNHTAVGAMLSGDRTAAVAVLAGVSSSAVNRCRRLHWGMTKVEIGGCVVCDRADLDEVDARILSKPVGYPTERGRTCARMAKELNVDPDALASHAKRHTRSATHQQRRALEAAARLAAVRQYVGAP